MTDRMRLTLKDVAAAAAVSEMTVSRVLSGRGTVSVRTRERVQAVVDEMGYVRNRLAGSLASARSDQVAVVIPSLVNAIFDEVVDGIAAELHGAGYNPVVGISDYDEAREEALVRSMMAWRPAGIILPAIGHTARTRAMLRAGGLPIVEIMNVARPAIDMSVGLHQGQVGMALGQHLLARRYRRIGWVGLDPRDLSALARFDGLQKTIAEGGGVLFSPEARTHLPITFQGGRDELADLMARHPVMDAVVFANDTAAAGGMMHCISADLKVPDDIALAGFGGLSSGQALPKRLTTVHAPRRDIGQVAARSILRRIDGDRPRMIQDLGFDIVIGEST